MWKAKKIMETKQVSRQDCVVVGKLFGTLACQFVAHTQLQIRKKSFNSRVIIWCVEYSNTPHCFWVMWDEEERRKKARWTKSKFSQLALSILAKVSKIYRKELAIDWMIFISFSFLCFGFCGAVPIPYVQVAILNLPFWTCPKSSIVLFTIDNLTWPPILPE